MGIASRPNVTGAFQLADRTGSSGTPPNAMCIHGFWPRPTRHLNTANAAPHNLDESRRDGVHTYMSRRGSPARDSLARRACTPARPMLYQRDAAMGTPQRSRRSPRTRNDFTQHPSQNAWKRRRAGISGRMGALAQSPHWEGRTLQHRVAATQPPRWLRVTPRTRVQSEGLCLGQEYTTPAKCIDCGVEGDTWGSTTCFGFCSAVDECEICAA